MQFFLDFVSRFLQLGSCQFSYALFGQHCLHVILVSAKIYTQFITDFLYCQILISELLNVMKFFLI